jgi:hypothetical protein
MEDQVSYNIMEQCPFTGRLELTDWKTFCPCCMDFMLKALSAFKVVIGSGSMDHPVNNNIFQFLCADGNSAPFNRKIRKIGSAYYLKGKIKGKGKGGDEGNKGKGEFKSKFKDKGKGKGQPVDKGKGVKHLFIMRLNAPLG